MSSRLPPWGAIEAFVVAAAATSFKEAAERLAINAPALSRRIQALEHHVDVRLFTRNGKGIALTPEGARYLELLRPGVETIQAATRAMTPGRAGRPVRLRVSSSLAAAWLSGRLGAFCAANPDIEISVLSGGRPRDLREDRVELGIYYGSGAWPELEVVRLFEIDAAVVAAPRLADGRDPPRSPQAIAGYRLLGLADPGDVWATWSRRYLPDGPRLAPTVTFDAAQPMYEAAASGLGLALGVRPLVTPFLADGRLVEIPGTALRWPGAYHAAASPRSLHAAPVRALWAWLKAQADKPQVDLAQVDKARVDLPPER